MGFGATAACGKFFCCCFRFLPINITKHRTKSTLFHSTGTLIMRNNAKIYLASFAFSTKLFKSCRVIRWNKLGKAT